MATNSPKTCTAPGHPECTITCDGGCIAWYWEPDGPCSTMCTGAAVIDLPVNLTSESRLSVMAKGVEVSSVVDALGPASTALSAGDLSSMIPADKLKSTIDLDESNITIGELITKISGGAK